MDKILVGTIFSNIKDYAIRPWFNNIRKFRYPQFDFCAVDNSKDPKYHRRIYHFFDNKKKESNIDKLTVLHTPRTHDKSEVFMADSANTLRDYFLQGGYTHLLYNECDVFPPDDILQILLAHRREIIGALFFTGAKKTSYPMLSQINYYWDKVVAPMKGYLETFYDIGEIHEPKEILSAGLGCVLIHRSIIEQFPFKADYSLRFHHDTLFTKDLWEAGIPNYYIPIICRHENVTWDIQRKMVGR